MKPIGVVRQIDALGRIVVPKELRRILDIKEGDSLELFLEDNNIVLRKYQPACMICGNARQTVTYKGRNFCPDCIRDMAGKLL